MYKDRIVVPPSLCDKVLHNFVSAHQGASSKASRDRTVVLWRGMTTDIPSTRDNCSGVSRHWTCREHYTFKMALLCIKTV